MRRSALGYNFYVNPFSSPAADIFHHFTDIISATVVLYTNLDTLHVKRYYWYVWQQNIINPRRACVARVTVLGLSVTTFSATTRNKAAKKRYQRVQCHTGFI